MLATFWSKRLRLPESELSVDLRTDGRSREVLPSLDQAAEVARIMGSPTPRHRQVIELRFLQGLSLREVATEMGKSVGSVKLMQLRALRKAAAAASSDSDGLRKEQLAKAPAEEDRPRGGLEAGNGTTESGPRVSDYVVQP